MHRDFCLDKIKYFSKVTNNYVYLTALVQQHWYVDTRQETAPNAA